MFDVLWLDGRDVTSLPLDERRALLDALPLRSPLERVAALDDAKPWERACREGWEGVIAKRRDSPYEHRRSPHWLKMKCEASQELVVGGFTDPQGGTRRPGRAAGRLLRAATTSSSPGRSAPASTRKLLLDLRARLDALEIPKSPFTKAVGLPRAARALGAAGDRRAGRLHRMDGARQASPLRGCCGFRTDKTAREVVRETP